MIFVVGENIMKTTIKVFIWIGMIFQFFLIFPIIVGALALKKLETARTKNELTGIAIAVLLLVNMVSGILMLTISDQDLNTTR
jgi:undecaprenyl pyrophosphate phosphatase UppP